MTLLLYLLHNYIAMIPHYHYSNLNLAINSYYIFDHNMKQHRKFIDLN